MKTACSDHASIVQAQDRSGMEWSSEIRLTSRRRLPALWACFISPLPPQGNEAIPKPIVKQAQPLRVKVREYCSLSKMAVKMNVYRTLPFSAAHVLRRIDLILKSWVNSGCRRSSLFSLQACRQPAAMLLGTNNLNRKAHSLRHLFVW